MNYCQDCKEQFEEFGQRDDSFDYEDGYGCGIHHQYSDCCPNCGGDCYDEILEWFFMDEKEKVMSHGFGDEHEAKIHAEKIGATEAEYNCSVYLQYFATNGTWTCLIEANDSTGITENRCPSRAIT